MPTKFHVKRGDEVVVISGTEKGKRGKIIQVVPKRERVIVEGIALKKCHQKPTQDNQEGGIVEREGKIHVSNVMIAETFDARKKRQK